jgi:hypothetical protein
MNEQSPEGLTPAQSEAVRRLLAAARHDEGIPDDVAARLEATIADLSAEVVPEKPADRRPAASVAREADIIPLHRRRWPKMLLAAAAVSLFGFGIAQYVDSGSNLGGGGSTADSKAARDAPLGEDFSFAPNAPAPSASKGEDSAVIDGLNGALLSLDKTTLSSLDIKGLRRLRPGALDRDLRDLAETNASGAVPGSAYDARAAALPCGPFYTVSGGHRFAAAYRHHLALVLFHPAIDGVRLVEIYDCESATPRRTVRTVTLQTGE